MWSYFADHRHTYVICNQNKFKGCNCKGAQTADQAAAQREDQTDDQAAAQTEVRKK